MQAKKKVLIVGGVAAGPKTGAKVRRLDPNAEITIIEKGHYLSYAGCGLPYYVSDVVAEQNDLLATPAGVPRDADFFWNAKAIRVRNHTEATAIDRENRRLEVRAGDQTEWLDYDALVLATGTRPVMPPIPGIDLEGIRPMQRVEDADCVRELLDAGVRDVVVVGAGLIGVEMVEALVERGRNVTVVEMLPQVMPMLDPEMAKLVENHMAAKGVTVMLDSAVERFEGDGRLEKVVTAKGEIPCQAAIVAIGVRPNVDLARAAGLELGESGAIKVNRAMRTSDPSIYAVGDCAEVRRLLNGAPAFIPDGSLANKQGRVAAINICGGDEMFPGVIGSTICKVFDFAVGRTGLNEREARELGYDVQMCLAPGPDRAHYYPAAQPLFLKMVADRLTGRLLGLQAVGPGDASKRLDVAATALTGGMTLEQLSNLDLCYAPPFSPAMDNIVTAANVLRNKIAGHMRGLTPAEVKARRDAGEDLVLLDVRGPQEIAEAGAIPGSLNIPLGTLRRRLDEVPRDRPIVAFCKISLRGYEAALTLQGAGFADVHVMDGGFVMWPYEKDGLGG